MHKTGVYHLVFFHSAICPPHRRTTRPSATILKSIKVPANIVFDGVKLNVRSINPYFLRGIHSFTILHRVATTTQYTSKLAPNHDRPRSQMARTKIWGYKCWQVRLADRGEHRSVSLVFSLCPSGKIRLENFS